jgi:2-C-methyl-D-erythritol 2,4-cyclodiphosphate synthase
MFKVGIGEDSHRFENSDKKLILAGKIIDNYPGLQGNSDGDVIFHAICNAISSAIGKGSIGTYADKMCKEDGITDSRKYLEYIYEEARKKGHLINNISISIEAKQPKIESHVLDFKKNISEILSVKLENIGITATSGEGLTDFGRGLGIRVICIISLI